MRALTINIFTQKMEIKVWGNGHRLLLCFHGFGTGADSFECLETSLGRDYTIVAMDLPHHGTAKWNKKYLEWNDLEEAIRLILNQFQQNKFSLLGYSMGGRLSLYVTQRLGEQVEELILIAPDGLKNNRWHLFATQTFTGNWLFRYSAYHPALFFGLLKAGKKTGLLDERLYKFAHQSMDSFAKREKVYMVWTCMKKMLPHKKIVKEIIRQNKIKTLLFFGKYDRVIPPVMGKYFCKNLNGAEMIVLEKGHNLLSAELAKIIRQKLKSGE